MSDELDKIKNQIMELLKGQPYFSSKDVLKQCLDDLKEVAIVS